MRIRLTSSVGLCVLLLAACSQSEHFEIQMTARIDFGALMAGVTDAEVVETPGGLRIPIELSQEIDLIQSSPSGVSLILDGGLVDIQSIRYAITSNTATVDLPRLLFLGDHREELSAAQAFGVAVMPGGDAESTQLFGDPVWLAVGPDRLAYLIRKVRFHAFLTGFLDLDAGDDVPTGVVDVALIIGVEVSEI